MELPPGLVLRSARPGDLEQIGALLAARGEPTDATDHRLVVEDPDLGWEACGVVVDGDTVVSTATLLDETVRVGDVVLPAGQVDLVATDAAYEGRGLVRALMGWAHERSARRGHVLQVMLGIPYFYRLFGYEYAIDLPRARRVDPDGLPPAGPGLRRAEPRDLPALAALQDAAQAGFDVAMPHPPARRRWLLEQEATTTWVLERDGTVVATARTTPPGSTLLVAEPAATDRAAADALLAALGAHAAQAGEVGLVAVHRPGTVTGDAWEARLAPPGRGFEQYYVRIPDAGVALDRLRPVLAARLAASGLDRTGTDVVVSTFGAHYRMGVTPDGLGPVASGGPMQDPGEHGAAGVAPDRFASLLLGCGICALEARHPDVYPGPDRDLFEALFPPVTADLLTYYLSW